MREEILCLAPRPAPDPASPLHLSSRLCHLEMLTQAPPIRYGATWAPKTQARATQTQILIPALPVFSSVTLGKWLDISESLSPGLTIGVTGAPTYEVTGTILGLGEGTAARRQAQRRHLHGWKGHEAWKWCVRPLGDTPRHLHPNSAERGAREGQLEGARRAGHFTSTRGGVPGAPPPREGGVRSVVFLWHRCTSYPPPPARKGGPVRNLPIMTFPVSSGRNEQLQTCLLTSGCPWSPDRGRSWRAVLGAHLGLRDSAGLQAWW